MMNVNILFIKSVMYRVYSSVITFIIALIATGNLVISASIGLADTIIKIFTYYIFDRLWAYKMYPAIDSCVILLTGLSGSGKTTIATRLSETLTKLNTQNIILDGDDIRQALNVTGFDADTRKIHNENVGRLASIFESSGKVVIISMISPYSDTRKYMRECCNNFHEVYLSTPISECIQRNPKGLYNTENMENNNNLTGVSAPYEVPTQPDLTINTMLTSINESVSLILKRISK